jgi:hypothetical protein
MDDSFVHNCIKMIALHILLAVALAAPNALDASGLSTTITPDLRGRSLVRRSLAGKGGKGNGNANPGCSAGGAKSKSCDKKCKSKSKECKPKCIVDACGTDGGILAGNNVNAQPVIVNNAPAANNAQSSSGAINAQISNNRNGVQSSNIVNPGSNSVTVNNGNSGQTSTVTGAVDTINPGFNAGSGATAGNNDVYSEGGQTDNTSEPLPDVKKESTTYSSANQIFGGFLTTMIVLLI